MAARTSRPHQPASSGTSSGAHALTAASADLVISFSLARAPRGVHLRRVRRCAGACVVTQSLLFDDEAALHAWREADELRFVYPLVYEHLARLAGELFRQVDG